MQRVHYAVAAGVFVLALCVYVATLAPSVAFIDSGALTVAAWAGGNAHPPGFPLYLMLTRLVTLLPVGSVAWRANLASALFAAAACAMTALVVGEALLNYTPSPAPPAPKKKKQAAVPATNTTNIPLAMALASSLLIFSRTLWGYATLAEVYALNSFLVATIVWMVLRWRRTRASRDLYIAALVFGLALGVHHVTVGLTLIGIAAFVFMTRIPAAREILISAVIAIVALIAVYAYLPLAAARKPVMNWGDPSTPAQIWQHVSGAQFRSFVSSGAGSSQTGVIKRLIGRELGPPLWMLMAIAGVMATGRRDRALLVLAILVVLGCCAWMLVYPIQNDREAYLLPAFIMLAAITAYGAAWLARGSRVVMAAFLILPILAAVVNWPYRNRSNWRLPQKYVENALRPIPRNSLLITSAEQLYLPAFYYQEVEKLRPDVRTLNWELLMRWWYVDQIERRYPGVFDGARKEVEAFQPSLLMFRDRPDEYNDPSVQLETNTKFDDLVLAVIRNHLQRGVNVYLTHELAFSRAAANQSFVQRLATSWELVPAGVAVAVVPKGTPRPPANTPIDLEGLTPLTMKYEDDDVVMLEVLPAYREFVWLRARYLAATGDLEGSIGGYRQARDLDPANERLFLELRSAEARYLGTSGSSVPRRR